jgi:hypothetical protein
MSQYEGRSWDLWGITQEDWEVEGGGWRRTFQDAVDDAFRDADFDKEYEIRIFVRKRSDNAVHDYRVQR